MSIPDLLDVLGGEDNLKLMCGAENFLKNAEGSWACFEFNFLMVNLFLIEPCFYGLFIKHIGEMRVVVNEQYLTPEQTREAFEEYTGYSLSF